MSWERELNVSCNLQKVHVYVIRLMRDESSNGRFTFIEDYTRASTCVYSIQLVINCKVQMLIFFFKCKNSFKIFLFLLTNEIIV